MSDWALRARTRLQRSVLRANRIPALRRLNTVPYTLSVAMLRRLCERTAGVSGGFVRSGLSHRDWTPGLSDVDPLLVLDGDLSPEGERAAVHEATRVYRRLQHVLPVLGELEIVSARHLSMRLENGVDAGSASSWLRLGAPPMIPGSVSRCDPWARELEALRAYRYHLLPWCWAARHEDPQGPFVRGRSAAKLRRSLGLPAAAAPDDRSAAEALVSGLAVLSASVAAAGRGERPLARALEQALADPEARVEYGELPVSLSEPALRALGCVLAPAEAPDRLYVVLSDDADEDGRIRCATEVLAQLPMPLVLDRRTFERLLVVADPLEHFTLLHGRVVLHGADPLPLPCSLDEPALRRSVLGYAVDMLGFPYSERWEGMTNLEFRNVLLGWYVRTVAFLADGVMEPAFDRQRDYYRAHYPELAAAVDPDVGSSDPGLRFAVLRALADEIAMLSSARSPGIPH